MLKRFRIEVEEPSPEAAVLALTKYEHAIQRAEVGRYALWYDVPGDIDESEPDWDDTLASRSFYNEQLGRELHEEVIEFDETIPAYKARRVVSFKRLDNRDFEKHSMEPGWCARTEVVG